LISLDQAMGLNNILFDTDKASIRPRYRALIREIARTISKRGQGLLEIQGHADLRGSAEYNLQLGMRRARAVFDAIAADLTPEVRQRLRIDVETTSGAVLGASNR
jgi:outer membrane protein OmpA-like peptidoglycan-associated protein